MMIVVTGEIMVMVIPMVAKWMVIDDDKGIEGDDGDNVRGDRGSGHDIR